jgi:hypothetical protein
MTRSWSRFPFEASGRSSGPRRTGLLGQRYADDLVHADHRSGFHLHPAGTLRFSSSGAGFLAVAV